MRIARKTAEPDEKLLRKYLLNERPVHIRRTLDQSYYWTLKDTQTRDIDQVVYRATAKPGKNMEDVKRVVMVDQLWLWILDGSRYTWYHRNYAKFEDRIGDFQFPATLGWDTWRKQLRWEK